MPCITLSSGKQVCFGDKKYPDGGKSGPPKQVVKPGPGPFLIPEPRAQFKSIPVANRFDPRFLAYQDSAIQNNKSIQVLQNFNKAYNTKQPYVATPENLTDDYKNSGVKYQGNFTNPKNTKNYLQPTKKIDDLNQQDRTNLIEAFNTQQEGTPINLPTSLYYADLFNNNTYKNEDIWFDYHTNPVQPYHVEELEKMPMRDVPRLTVNDERPLPNMNIPIPPPLPSRKSHQIKTEGLTVPVPTVNFVKETVPPKVNAKRKQNKVNVGSNTKTKVKVGIDQREIMSREDLDSLRESVGLDAKGYAVGGKTTNDDKPAFERTADTVDIKSGTRKRLDRVMPWEAPLKPGAWGGLDMRGMRAVTPDQQQAMDFATQKAQANKVGKFYMDGTNYRLSNSDELEKQRLLESDTTMGSMARSWANTSNDSPIMKAYQEGTGDAAKLVLGMGAGIMAAPAALATLGGIGSTAAAATTAPTVLSGLGNVANAAFTGYELYNATKYGADAVNKLAEGDLAGAGMSGLKAGTYSLGVGNAPIIQQAIGNSVVEGLKGYKETGDLGKSIVRGVGAGVAQKFLGDAGHKLHLNHSVNEALSKYPTNNLFKSITTPSPTRVLAGDASLESNIDSNNPYLMSKIESRAIPTPLIAQLPIQENGGKNNNMKNGINNPGFKSLPGFVQKKIVANMEVGGLTMPGVDDKIVKKGVTPNTPPTKENTPKQLNSQQIANMATTFFSRDPSMQMPLPNFLGGYRLTDEDKTLMFEGMKRMKASQGANGIYAPVTAEMIDQLKPMLEKNRTIDQPMERAMGGMNSMPMQEMSITDPDYEQMMLQYGGMVEDLDGGQIIQKFGKGGGITYRGHKFPGYNKPIKAPAGDKYKKMVLVKKGDKVRLLKIGYKSKTK